LKVGVNLLLGAVLIAVTGCGSSSGGGRAEKKDDRLTIVTTAAMVTDIVAQVAGDRARVVGLMGTGVDPHLYKPTTDDVSQLIEADVVFYSGLHLEAGMDEAFKRAAGQGRKVFAVTEEIAPAFLLHPPEFEGHPDPHVWMDVPAWSECAAFVAKALGEFDPPHAEQYRQNAERYRAELAQLDDYALKVIATIPEEQRHLVTAHDAFEYFARAYGIQVKSVQGITTESEPGVDDINQLVSFLVENQVPALFVESSVNRRNIDAVIEGAARQGWQVRVGGTLFSDAMGSPGTYEGTYIGMIDHNATLIARALGGEAPEKGMQGKLGVSTD
jgi:manganese/zinc/iron transport system substrate-binding protein